MKQLSYETKLKMAKAHLNKKIRPNKWYKLIEDLQDLCSDGYMPAVEDLWVDPYGSVKRVKIWEDDIYVADVKPSLSKANYWQVGTKGRAYPVHILVAYAFIGPRPEGYDVNHKDHNHDNNEIFNIEYLTIHENRSDNH